MSRVSESQAVYIDSVGYPAAMRGFGRTDLLLLTVVLTWAINFRAGQTAGLLDDGGNLDPRTLIVLRSVLASTALVPLAALASGKRVRDVLRLDRHELGLFALLGLVAVPGNQFLFLAGMQRTSTIHGALMFALSPAIAGILTAALGTDRGSGKVWLGGATAFVGVALVAARAPTGLDGPRTDADPTLIGDLVVLASATCWATYNALAVRALARRGFLEVTALAMGLGAVASLVLFGPVLVSEVLDGSFARVTGIGWASILYLAYVGAIWGWVVWTRGIERIGPVRTMLYQYLIPVTAMILGVSFHGEAIGLQGLVGAALVFAGIWVGRAPADPE